MDYLYIDESGKLGKQTKYFVLGSIMIEDTKRLDKIIKTARNKYRKQLGNSPEIKGYSTDNYIIKKILKKLNRTNYDMIAIILNKKNIPKHMPPITIFCMIPLHQNLLKKSILPNRLRLL